MKNFQIKHFPNFSVRILLVMVICSILLEINWLVNVCYWLVNVCKMFRRIEVLMKVMQTSLKAGFYQILDGIYKVFK